MTVSLPHHSYDLHIERGALGHVGQWVSSLWEPQQIMVISDDRVASIYGDNVVGDLQRAGFKVDIVTIPEGEPSKSLASAEMIYEVLAKKGMTRKDGIIGLGGGVVGDLTGFVSSTYMRGLHFLQIPTTLLAQVDSSVGGKTAVNTASAKNLVGTFAQPDGVLIDIDTLKTLEPRRVREGIAEIIKTAAIADPILWEKLVSYTDEQELLDHVEEVVIACCDVKRKVVEEDELDNGQRLILNFGHTIGHAIENTAGYGVVTHGEGVAIGMVQINRIAEKKGETPQGTTEQLINMLTKFSLPIEYDNWNIERLYSSLTHDKKTQGNKIRIILLDEIGTAKIVPISLEEMKDYLEKE